MSDCYTCGTCGQTVLTTLGQHYCPGPGQFTVTIPASNTSTWNGGYCQVCGERWLYGHLCQGRPLEALRREVEALRAELAALREAKS